MSHEGGLFDWVSIYFTSETPSIVFALVLEHVPLSVAYLLL